MFADIFVNQKISDHIAAKFSILIWPGAMKLNNDFVIEIPSAPIAGVHVPTPGIFGAYSYSWSQITRFVASVGRYCSIAGMSLLEPTSTPPTGLYQGSESMTPGGFRDAVLV